MKTSGLLVVVRSAASRILLLAIAAPLTRPSADLSRKGRGGSGILSFFRIHQSLQKHS
jgi:hypothetical protein